MYVLHILLLVLTALILTITGCGGEGEEESPYEHPTVTAINDASPEPTSTIVIATPKRTPYNQPVNAALDMAMLQVPVDTVWFSFHDWGAIDEDPDLACLKGTVPPQIQYEIHTRDAEGMEAYILIEGGIEADEYDYRTVQGRMQIGGDAERVDEYEEFIRDSLPSLYEDSCFSRITGGTDRPIIVFLTKQENGYDGAICESINYHKIDGNTIGRSHISVYADESDAESALDGVYEEDLDIWNIVDVHRVGSIVYATSEAGIEDFCSQQ